MSSALGQATDIAQQAATFVPVDWNLALIGIILIIATILIILFLRHIILNSILGLIAWAIVVFVFKIEMSIVPTLIVSALFGLAGIGTILILKFLGVSI